MKKTLVAAAGALLLLAGCSVPASVAPDQNLTLPERFSASGPAPAPEQWWRTFDDPGLDTVIDTALAANLSLQASWERLAQARAVAVKSGADRYPDLSLNAGASASKTLKAGSDQSDTYTAGIAASYEIDLWGRVASTAEAAAYDVKTSEAELRTAALSLSAEAATLWYRLQGAHRQADLLRAQQEITAKHLALTERQFRSAQAEASDVLQQRQNLEAIRGDLLLTEKSIRLYELQLDVLLGRLPGSGHYAPVSRLAEGPALPDTGVPSELLMHRPDVLAAYYDLQASDRRIAAAVAERYPKLSLSASLQSSAAEAGDLFRDWIANLAANLALPLIDGGTRRAEVARTEAVRNAALYTYSQTLLEAYREVEDALVSLQTQHAYVESLDAQLALSESAVERLRGSYLHGKGSFESFLNAQLSYQNLQRSRVTAAQERLEQQIELYRSLSTGWEPQRTPKQQGSTHERP